MIRNGLDRVAANKTRSIAFQTGRLTGSLISIGQAILEVGTGVPLMGCGTVGAGVTSWTGVGVLVGGGVAVVGATVTAHGVMVGVVSAANVGDIAGNIYWMATEGSGGGADRSQGSGQMSDEEIEFLRQLSEDSDTTFVVTGRRSETNRGLENRRKAFNEYGADAPEYGVPGWRNTGPSTGQNKFDYFVRGGDLPDKVKQALRGRYGNDLEFDNWGELKGDPYQLQDPGGIIFDRGKVYRNFLEPWQ